MSAPVQKPIAFDRFIEGLPVLVGKTIERTIVVWHEDERWQIHLIFSDGSSYEFYGKGYVSGVRQLTFTVPTGGIGAWMEGRGEWSVVVPEP